MFVFCLDRFRAFILSVFFIVGFALPAFAGPFEDAVAKFANDEFSDTEEAVGAIASSGNPLAFPIISALQDGRLSTDPDSKKVFITQADDKIIDAATGAAVDKLPDNAAAVRLNNRLRRTVEAALGGLTLLSPDPAKRVAAAQSVFRPESALPVIEGAREGQPARHGAFTRRAPPSCCSNRLFRQRQAPEAVAVIRRAAIGAVMLTSPAPTSRRWWQQWQWIASIRQLAMWSMVQNAWYGLSLGSVLLLAAIGLAITFGVMGINMPMARW